MFSAIWKISLMKGKAFGRCFAQAAKGGARWLKK